MPGTYLRLYATTRTSRIKVPDSYSVPLPHGPPMDPQWRAQLHNPTPPTPLPPYLQATVDSALTVITPSLFGQAPPSSLLLIAPPSSGKSLVTARILTTLNQTSPDLLHLPLTGLLHSTPLRAWRHLATKLSQHSHASSTVQQCLHVITTTLSTLHTHRTPVIVTLDYFDRFITTTDGTSQTVLYSLLNYLQDRRMRIALLASTASIDVTDSLEKRVKSRFLHRQLIIPLPSTASEVLSWVAQLVLPPPAAPKRGKPTTSTTSKFVTGFLSHERCVSATRKAMLKTRVVAGVLRAVDAALFAGLHEASRKSVKLKIAHALHVFESVLNGGDADGARVLSGLTELEMVLLMGLRKVVRDADKRGEKRGDGSAVVCFADVFRCYEKGLVEEGFSCGKERDRVVERGVAEKCWEGMVECGAVVRIGNGPRETRGCLLGVAGVDVDKALRDHDVASSLWKDWGNKG